MAHPRIFLSSTYYDLRNVRSDLERFIRDMGYDPVLNERGNISYGAEDALEDYCYKEINNCDMVISIIGGRFGTTARSDESSISNKELTTAIELGKQVYIFIDKSVYAEFRTYEKNKKIIDIQYAAVDDIRIYHFIETVQALPANNNIAGFETSSDIIFYLKEQWSGLFQRLLNENSKKKEFEKIEEIKATAKTLEQLVTALSKERRETDSTIKDILISNHPAFTELKSKLDIPFRVFFTNFTELQNLLFSLKDKKIVKDGEVFYLDEPYHEWMILTNQGVTVLRINRQVFDSYDKLKSMTPDEWDDKFIQAATTSKDLLYDMETAKKLNAFTKNRNDT